MTSGFMLKLAVIKDYGSAFRNFNLYTLNKGFHLLTFNLGLLLKLMFFIDNQALTDQYIIVSKSMPD